MIRRIDGRWRRLRGLAAAGAPVLAILYFASDTTAQSPAASAFPGPTSSQTLALSPDGTMLAVANPDSDTVTFFEVEADRNRRLAEIRVQSEPNAVAFNRWGTRAYVANTVSGTVSVLSVNRSGAHVARVLANVRVGTEPYALVMTPNGNKLYIANSRSNNVSVMDPNTNVVYRTIESVGFEPRGMAVTNDGDTDDDDETLFVSQFLAVPVTGRLDGEDDSKLALVTAISAASDSIQRTITVRPMADTGFRAAGDAIQRIAPPATPQAADFRFTTGAYANQLNNLAVKGDYLYVPSTGASPNGPVRFNVNTQSLLNVIDLNRNQDSGRTINMHTAVRDQPNPEKLFVTQPWAVAFKHRSNEGYVVSAASNHIVKVGVDPATGAASVQRSATDNTRVNQIRTGRNPRGIVINRDDTRAYVMNYISRDVTVVDLRGPERVLATLRSSALPEAGSNEDMLHIGKELYNTSIGDFDPAPGTIERITGRMSSEGWGSCASCHPFGLTDNVVWIFAAGPRRTVSQHTDFDFTEPANQRALNWSAIFDEEEDFENNIRGVSGGLGLIVGADGRTPDPNVAGLAGSNARRNQLKVRGVNAWDAIKAFIQCGIRAPISPVAKDDPEVLEGEQIFRQANCQSCHGGPQWTTSRISPPVAPTDLSSGQIIGQLRKVGTFNPEQRNEVRANAAAPLGLDGFVPPSLLSLFAFPRTFFHNGSADSLDQVMSNAVHRSAGTDGVDLLDDAEQRRKLIKFLNSIDSASTPIWP